MTSKQEKLLNFISEYIKENGYSPSIREIAKNLGVKSPSAVKVMIDRLEKSGYLNRSTGVARSLMPAVSSKGVPVLGHIVAGVPVTAEENIEGYIQIDGLIKHSDNLFFLIVDGYSMKDKGILPGDYVLIKPTNNINNGQIGVFRINGEVTLKTYNRNSDGIFLLPANDSFSPIQVSEDDDFEVIGIYMMLIRTDENLI